MRKILAVLSIIFLASQCLAAASSTTYKISTQVIEAGGGSYDYSNMSNQILKVEK